MATTRELLNAIMFSGMLDMLPPVQIDNYLRNVAKNVPKYVYKFDKVVGTPPTAANTRIVATERYELEKVGKYTVLHCIESQMRAIAHLPKCKAEPMLMYAIDEYEKEHK
ncbi:hypothetical protein [Fibrobacter sp.]|uniref:hypothetical protein n=1 Tax=Fibrobacter sp. TaxID=35828 RepID=UPI00386DE971